MPQRIDLDKQLTPARRTIDSTWSDKKKAAVGGAAGLFAVAALGWGVWSFIDSRPPKMPTTADEAAILLASDKFNELDAGRKNDLRMEAVRLLRDAAPEERQAMMQKFEDPEVRRQIGEAFMEETARQFARTGEMQPFWGRMGGGPPEGQRRREPGEGGPPGTGENRQPGEGGPGGGRPGGGEGDAQSREDRRAQFANRMMDRMANGDAQSMALMGEYFRSMRARMEAAQQGGGGGGRPGGGG